jgi:hypothetical protein
VCERHKAVLQGMLQRDQLLEEMLRSQEQVMPERRVAIPAFQYDLNVIRSNSGMRGVIAQVPAWVLINSRVYHWVSFLKQKDRQPVYAGFAIGSPILAPTGMWVERPSKRIGSMPPSLMVSASLRVWFFR